MSNSEALDGRARQPDHVPDKLVYDFDMYFDEALLEDAPARLLQIAHDSPPIFWSPHQGGQWFVRGYRELSGASRDWENFSSQGLPPEELEELLAAQPDFLLPVPVSANPPEHAKYRGPLNAVFSPKRMLALQDKIRALTIRQIDEVKDRGGCEFVSAIAGTIPVEVFLEIFGMALDRQEEFRDIVIEFLASPAIGQSETQGRLRKIADVLHDTLVDRRQNPRDDLISVLWSTAIDGKPPNLHDMENYTVALFIAGLDTVINAMSHGVRHLAADRELQDRLRANPELIPEASEEMLRRFGLVTPMRVAGRDFEYEGVHFKRGDRIVFANPIANLDAREFPDPGMFDIERENKVHLTFGGGPHRCLGAHLARIEMQTMYEEILARLPAFRLDPERPVRYHGGMVVGPQEVHLVWN